MGGSSWFFSSDRSLTGELFVRRRVSGFFLGLRFFGGNFFNRITGVFFKLSFRPETGAALLIGGSSGSFLALVEVPPGNFVSISLSVGEVAGSPVGKGIFKLSE